MKKTTGAKSRKAAKTREAKAAKKPKAAAGQREKKRDDRPLEVRYREARERAQSENCTKEEYREYAALLDEYESPAEHEKRDEIAYSDADAACIRRAFEGALVNSMRQHYEKLTEREKRHAMGLYDGLRYFFMTDDYQYEMSQRAEACARTWGATIADNESEREELEAAAKVGRARMAYEAALAGACVPVAPDAPAPVAPVEATPAASLTSRLCDRPLSVGKGKTTHVFVRRGNTKRDGGGKGYTITFGLWQGKFYTESPRVLTFFEDALKAMSKRLMGKAENEGYVKLPDGVTSRNATAKLWQGKADRTMRSCLKFGKGPHKNEARLEIPSSYL